MMMTTTDELLTATELDQLETDLKTSAASSALNRRVGLALRQVRGELATSRTDEARVRNQAQIHQGRIELYRDLMRAVCKRERSPLGSRSWGEAHQAVLAAIRVCMQADTEIG